MQGDLSPHISVCTPESASGWQYTLATHGISGCGVDTSVPGRYVIDFRVVNDVGLSSSVRRQVLVEDLCLGGERVCANLQCSVDGVCLDELLSVVHTPSRTARLIRMRGPSLHFTLCMRWGGGRRFFVFLEATQCLGLPETHEL